MPARRLTEYSHGAGCGCKLAPGSLTEVLSRLQPARHPDLLVGTDTGDDAAVWRLDDDRALVATTDFFTPIVDDARTWGAIAAANAASDVYAMGGRPLFALNLVAWPTEELGTDLLAEVLQGAADVAAEGGWLTVGGHSIDDPEPKFGLAMIGEVAPSSVRTNAGLRPGDHLVLSKPIGVGIVTTAAKLGRVAPDALELAERSMRRLNAAAAAVALAAGATAMTDVTGFGLLGHLWKMVEASGAGATVFGEQVPLLPSVAELAAEDVVPGGTRRNLEWVRPHLDLDRPSDGDVELLVLADAQTSGGLLFGVPGMAQADEAVSALAESGHQASVVGRVTDRVGRILVS